ncbi:MAG: branched-chain amino acid ABC transporter permease [Ilumatobacteraceae bacterium]
MLLLSLATLVAPGTAHAQDDDSDALSDQTEQGVFGVLEVADQPVEGVAVRVARDGGEVGTARSASDGTWRVGLPEAGTYQVELITDTLPADVELRDPDDNLLDRVRVSPGRDQRVRFAFAEENERSSGSTVMPRLINTAWNGLKFGLVVALCSIGLSLVFGTTGLVNFAHAELITFGALAAWFFNSPTVGPQVVFLIAAPLAVVVSGGVGAGLHTGLWRSLERRRVGLVSLMIVSIGLGFLARYGFAVVFGNSPRTYDEYAAQSPWSWGALVFPPKDLVIIPLCVLVLLVVALALQRSRLGIAIRAVSDNRDLAESSGIDVQQTVLVVWVLAAGLAGLGGLVFGLTQAVQWDMGFRLLLIVFAAVILGGLGSAYGPMIGGLVVGFAGEMSTLFFSAEFQDAFALGALILVLLVRPQGILGLRERVG